MMVVAKSLLDETDSSILSLMQPSLFPPEQWTVSRITKYIRDLMEADAALQDVWVSGEISNLSRPASGHVYFTLKDAGASLRSVMWKTNATRAKLALQDGMAVTVHGNIGVYEVSGQYQLYVDLIQPAGEGALYMEFLRLRAALEAEGLFDPAHKRPIPAFPRQIGIVTSSTGAALRDMLIVLRRRMPLGEVTLVPTPVQGEEAPARIVSAIETLNRHEPRPDVILVARGGGSIEDLWAFNDERVVRAVAASEVPIISGVGHETDFSLSDFAADLRAPTPSAAAELATPITLVDLGENLRSLEEHLSLEMLELVHNRQNSLLGLSQSLRFESPRRRIESDLQHLDALAHRLGSGISHRLTLEMNQFNHLDKRLQALNPLQVLGRGYAVVTLVKDDTIVRKASQARGAIRVRVSDGAFQADVKK